MNRPDFYQFSTLTILLLLAAFYGGTYLLTLLIKKKKGARNPGQKSKLSQD